MTDRVTVNRTRTALLPDNSPEKGFRITREEAHKLGLLDSAEKPVQKRRVEEPIFTSAAGPLGVDKPAPKPKRKYTKRK